MRKLFGLVLLNLFIIGSLLAQNEYSWQEAGYKFFFPQYHTFNYQSIKKQNVKSIEISEKSNGKIKNKFFYTFDNKGNNDSYTRLNNKGQIREKYLIENTNSKNTSSLLNSKNKELKKVIRIWDSIQNFEETSYFRHGKLKVIIKRNFNKYIDRNNKNNYNITKSELYKNGTDLKKEWIYSYYPDNSKKTSTIYNAKGKVIYVWNYDCKSEGELVQKHKDTTLVCKNDELDENGNRIIVERKFDDKGHPKKVVTKRNKENKIISYEEYNRDGFLVYKIIYNEQFGNWKELTEFNKKGVETLKWTKSFDIQGNITEECKYAKKMKRSTTINTINEKGMIQMSKEITYKKNGNQKESEILYDYLYY